MARLWWFLVAHPPLCWWCVQASSAYTAGPHHAMFSLSLSSIYKQDVLSSSTDFLRVDGVPVSADITAEPTVQHLLAESWHDYSLSQQKP